jgi:hypothetical protein
MYRVSKSRKASQAPPLSYRLERTSLRFDLGPGFTGHLLRKCNGGIWGTTVNIRLVCCCLLPQTSPFHKSNLNRVDAQNLQAVSLGFCSSRSDKGESQDLLRLARAKNFVTLPRNKPDQKHYLYRPFYLCRYLQCRLCHFVSP